MISKTIHITDGNADAVDVEIDGDGDVTLTQVTDGTTLYINPRDLVEALRDLGVISRGITQFADRAADVTTPGVGDELVQRLRDEARAGRFHWAR